MQVLYVIDEQALRLPGAGVSACLRELTVMTKAGSASQRRHIRPRRSSGSSPRSGLGCDVVGAGELRLALVAGIDPAKIVMHGNAKSDDDIRGALDARIGYIVVDGFDDIDRIEKPGLNAPPPCCCALSPGIDSATHAALAGGGITQVRRAGRAGARGNRQDAGHDDG